jgi:hypothetical protein
VLRGFFILAFALVVASLARPAAAQQPVFSLPVACEMGIVCTVQNYVDHDAGPGVADYTCGQLAYDGHDGTDIRVPNMTFVARGVPVLAAAAGTVVGRRDGVRDVNVREIGAEAVAGIDCGNGVLLDHGGGWVTQYCHMRQGSVQVRQGQLVAAGDVLGLIGMSGRAEFPHLHIEIRHQDRSVDPFVGVAASAACGAERRPLWSAEALAQLSYQATGVLNAGFTSVPPETAQIMVGQHQDATLAADAPALVFWVEVFGMAKGDRTRVRILAPDGRAIADNTAEPSTQHWASRMTYNGLRRTVARWPAGIYRGEYVLERMTAGIWTTVLTVQRSVVVR